MGYFSNGSEGEGYQYTYCFKCVNWKKDKFGVGCPIWDIHGTYSYELCNEKDNEGKIILDTLIPINKKTIQNEKCLMFIEKTYK